MKRMGVLLAVALVAASILSGCIVAPAEGWHHHRGEYYGDYRGGGYYGDHRGGWYNR